MLVAYRRHREVVRVAHRDIPVPALGPTGTDLTSPWPPGTKWFRPRGPRGHNAGELTRPRTGHRVAHRDIPVPGLGPTGTDLTSPWPPGTKWFRPRGPRGHNAGELTRPRTGHRVAHRDIPVPGLGPTGTDLTSPWPPGTKWFRPRGPRGHNAGELTRPRTGHQRLGRAIYQDIRVVIMGAGGAHSGRREGEAAGTVGLGRPDNRTITNAASVLTLGAGESGREAGRVAGGWREHCRPRWPATVS